MEMEILYFMFGLVIVGIPVAVYFLIMNFIFAIWERPSGWAVICWLITHVSLVATLFWCYFCQFIPDAVSDAYDVSFIAALVLCTISSFISIRARSIICPNCHSWNKFTTKKVDVEHYVSTENIQRNVYNKRGDRIGYFDDTVDVNRVRRHGQFKCKKCGATFNQTY